MDKIRSIGPRCEICDYTENDGSVYADREVNGDTVRLRPTGKVLCLTCYDQSTDFNPLGLADEDGELPLIDTDFEDFES